MMVMMMMMMMVTQSDEEIFRPSEFRQRYQVDNLELLFIHSIAISFEIRIDYFGKAGNLPKFDLVFSFSSVEHSGLGE